MRGPGRPDDVQDGYDAEYRYDRTPVGALQGIEPAQHPEPTIRAGVAELAAAVRRCRTARAPAR
jgi:hypothetical protein